MRVSRPVLTKWHTAQASQMHVEMPRDFVALNRAASVAGCRNAKEATQYRTTHDLRVVPPVVVRSDEAFYASLAERTFGKPGGPSTPVHKIMNHGFALDYVEKQLVEMRAKEGAHHELATSKSSATTKAAIGHATGRNKKLTRDLPTFTMKMFQNVPARLVLPTGATPRGAITPPRVRAERRASTAPAGKARQH